MCNKKDNPVPLIKVSELANAYIKDNEIINISELSGIFGFASYLTQNGVETDNEQPKFKLSEWCNEFKNGTCECNAHSEKTLCNEVRYGS